MWRCESEASDLSEDENEASSREQVPRFQMIPHEDRKRTICINFKFKFKLPVKIPICLRHGIHVERSHARSSRDTGSRRTYFTSVPLSFVLVVVVQLSVRLPNPADMNFDGQAQVTDAL